MDNIVVTLLDKSDALVSENKLKCFKKYGMSAAYTDMFSITGGKSNLDNMSRVSDEFGLKSRTASYVFNTLLKNGNVFTIDEAGNKNSVSENDNSFGIRPIVMTYDDIFKDLVKNKKAGYNGVEEVELGEYPQYAAAHMVGLALEDEYSNHIGENGYNGGVLIPTSKSYTFVQDDKLVSYPEYYYGSNKFIRVIVSCDEKGVILSNGNTVHNGEAVWVKVTPVKWFVDSKDQRLISKYVLLSGLHPDIRMFDFFSKYMKEDLFVDALTKDKMLRMICERFYNLDTKSQVEWVKGIPCDCTNMRYLPLDQIKSLLDSISNYGYGYSRKLNQYYF